MVHSVDEDSGFTDRMFSHVFLNCVVFQFPGQEK